MQPSNEPEDAMTCSPSTLNAQLWGIAATVGILLVVVLAAVLAERWARREDERRARFLARVAADRSIRGEVFISGPSVRPSDLHEAATSGRSIVDVIKDRGAGSKSRSPWAL